VAVLPVAAEHADAAWRLARALADDDRRVEVDDSDNTLALRVRRARERKAPYVLVLGDREVGSGTVAVRRRDGQRMPVVPIEEFRAHLADRVRSRGREL
jgi:threonyl-tRNA synthetase